MVKKILGIDMGTNSIGWSFIEADDKGKPVKLLDANVRIYSTGRDPKGESLAVARRMKRGQRRRRDRLLQRKHDVMSLLIRFGLMPADPAQRKAIEGKTGETGEAWENHPYNPYMLRAKAVHEKLEPYKLGRALFHLNQRRGFKSNRKIDKADSKKETEKGKEKLQSLLQGKTLGEYLWEQHQKRETVRFRPTALKSGKNSYDLYPTREMSEHEFDAIRQVQEEHQKLTSEQWQTLKNKIIFQRPLKKPKVGKCQLYFEAETVHPETGEITSQQERAPLALSSSQYFRIIQDINNLKVRYEPFGAFAALDNDKDKLAQKRHALFDLFRSKKEIPFDDIREELELPEEAEFNLEAKRTKLKGDSTYSTLKKYFGKDWLVFSLEKQDSIVTALLENEDKELYQQATGEWGLDEETARELVEKVSPTSFDNGYGRLSQKALHSLVPLMQEGLRYDEACPRLGVSHSAREYDGQAIQLPYYAEAMPESVVEPHNPESTAEQERRGKISNPTVHIGLRQLQKIINEIIKDKNLGKPDIIRIELARDLKMSQEEKDKLASEQYKEEQKNEEIKKDLTEMGEWTGSKGEKLLRVRLWEELNHDVNDRKCPYTGKQISKDRLFSDEIEIEHILPFSRTLDDSRANKTLALRSVNRDKLNKSPYEAFSGKQPIGSGDKDYSYERILQRASTLPANKRWRFGADAMKRFTDENEFLARQLNDTRYLSKVAKRYLSLVCKHVDVSPGRLTAILRRAWGLNEVLGHNRKNRDDHRQHAIDAVVIALTDKGAVQKVMTLNARGENPDKIIAEDLPVGFWEQVRDKVAGTDGKPGLVVSHRPDHGTGGPLLKDGNYGLIRDIPQNKDEIEGGYKLVERIPLESVSLNHLGISEDKRKQKILVRDKLIRKQLTEIVKSSGLAEDDEEGFQKLIQKFKSDTGIRSVRVITKGDNFVVIEHGAKKQHKKAQVIGENHHVSFWRLPDGKIVHKFCSFLDVKKAEASKAGNEQLKPHPAAKLLLKIHKADLLRFEANGEDLTVRVMALNPSQNQEIKCVEHYEAGIIEKRAKEKDVKLHLIGTHQIIDRKVRKIFVSQTGKVYDPGPLNLDAGKKYGTSD